MSESSRLPNGPSTPAFVNTALFVLARDRSQKRLKRRYGDAYSIKLPGMGRAVVVAHPDLVKQIFVADPAVLHAGENSLGQVIGPGSLFSMDEERHLEERRALLPPFHGDRMRSYDALIEEEARRAFALWPDDQDFASLPAFNTITLRVILRAVFGAQDSELVELQELLPRMTAIAQPMVAVPALMRPFGRFSPGARYRRMVARYRTLVDRLVDQHLADPGLDERIDILAMMLRPLRDEGRPIDRRAIAEELFTLLAAGHETTASSLAWTVERLRRHPHVLARLEDEIAAGDGATLRAATILEVQRLRPVINGAAPRLVKQPFALGEWLLPPGTSVLTLGSVMHRDGRFHDAPDAFDPERYVGRKPDTYAWIPFGGGRRRCLGAAFALRELDVVLRTLLSEFALLPTDAPDEPESFRGLAFAPGKGGVARVRRRAAPRGAERPAAAAAGCPVAHG